MWNVVTLARLVDEMRVAQRDYFRDHTRSSLERAKGLEKRVDSAVLQVLCNLPQQAPMPLFEGVAGRLGPREEA